MVRVLFFALPLRIAIAQPVAAASSAHPVLWPPLPPGLLIRPRIETFIDAMLKRMTLEEKVGQMVQADIGSIRPDDLKRYRLGSVLAGGGAAPDGDVHASGRAWRDMVAAYKAAALAPDGAGHAGIPLIFGIDAVHGDAKIRGATIFPHNVGLGAMHDPALMRRIGEATAEEVKATGVDWAFAPTVAVARDVRWGRSFESYSDDPALVAGYAGSMVSGLQGRLGTTGFLDRRHVLASAKHFLGDGGTSDGRDQADNDATEATLRDVHAPGYRAAVQAGTATVMASYSSWRGTKMHANASLLTGVLKRRWGFDGFVVGDWNAQEELPGCTRFSCAGMVNAGVDMVMAPDSWRPMYANLLAQVRGGVIPRGRIDDAVRRILRVKALAGLIGPSAAVGMPPDLGVIGSAAHRALARQAVRESLVLLRNDGHLLPLSPRRHVLVVGSAADAIGQQSGGWTVDWQGSDTINADFPGATSIFAGIRAAVVSGGGTATLSPDGSFTGRPDVAIVVFGEPPYAEFEGDRETLVLAGLEPMVATLRRLRAAGIPVVSVLLSGRPLWMNPALDASDAFVAAWLPGSEGEGVADVLFRSPAGAVRDFTGRLSFAWPRTGMPVTYDAGGAAVGPLFPRGYGLSDAASAPAVPWQALPEDPEVPPDWNNEGSFFAAGHVIAPWSIYLADAAGELRMTSPQVRSPGGRLQARIADGALTARWAAPASLRIGGRPVDLAAAGSALSVRYRLEAPALTRVAVGLLCGAHCGAWVDPGSAWQRGGGWHRLTIPLACFADGGGAPHTVDTPLALEASGPATLSLSSVALVPATAGNSCPQRTATQRSQERSP